MLNADIAQKIQHIALSMQNSEALHYEDSPQNYIWHTPHGTIANSDEILCELQLRKNTDGVHWYAYACSHHEIPQTFVAGLVVLLKRPEGDSLADFYNHFYLLAMQSCMATTYHHNVEEVYRESCGFLKALDDIACIIDSFNGDATSDEDANNDRFNMQIYTPILFKAPNIDISSCQVRTYQ